MGGGRGRRECGCHFWSQPLHHEVLLVPTHTPVGGGGHFAAATVVPQPLNYGATDATEGAHSGCNIDGDAAAVVTVIGNKMCVSVLPRLVPLCYAQGRGHVAAAAWLLLTQ